MKRKEVTRKQDVDWKTETARTFEQDSGDISDMAQFGLKIKSRSDDYIMPIFDDFEE